MKILVFPHDLEIGGSQINAIELAAILQRRGHSLVIFGRRGALNHRIEELGLEFIEAPKPHHRPTPAIVRSLVELVRERKLDILHGFEWPPTLECTLAARRTSAAAVSTVMSMAVAPFIPRTLPVTVGTAEILATERAFGRSRAELLEPPVDLEQNNPHVDVGADAFRQRWGIEPTTFLIVVVTRLAVELKLEGLLSAVKAVGSVAPDIPVTLLIAGDGAARNQVDAAAACVNASRRRSVIVAGQISDPRPAYAAADVVLGMGSSALRAMAFAKPVIVQGERGFWELLTPESAPLFLHQGWFGLGPGTAAGTSKLAVLIRTLYEDPGRRNALSEFSQTTVAERFSLPRAADIQENFYRRAIDCPEQTHIGDDLAASGRFIAHHVAQRARRLFGPLPVDDFNAQRRAVGDVVQGQPSEAAR